MRFEERYASAIRSSNLRSDAKTTFSSTDVLGAAGLAEKQHPLAFALLRICTGDNGASDQVIEMLEQMLVGKSHQLDKQRRRVIKRSAASLMARLLLDWFRDPVCRYCGGHGYRRLDGAPTLSDKACAACNGAGRREFESLFPSDRVDLARWAIAEIEREAARAGPAAMAALAPRPSSP